MTIELIDIAVRDCAQHPRLKGRITGHVRAVLCEAMDGREQLHELVVAVWADIAEETPQADVDMALMLKAAAIIARLKANLAGEIKPVPPDRAA